MIKIKLLDWLTDEWQGCNKYVCLMRISRDIYLTWGTSFQNKYIKKWDVKTHFFVDWVLLSPVWQKILYSVNYSFWQTYCQSKWSLLNFSLRTFIIREVIENDALWSYLNALILFVLTFEARLSFNISGSEQDKVIQIICWYFVTQVWLPKRVIQDRGTVKTLIRHSGPRGHVDLLSAYEMLSAWEMRHHTLLFKPLWLMSHAAVLAWRPLIRRQREI